MQNEQTGTGVKLHDRPFVRWTLLFAGTVFVGIGILGIFLPLLPTTVFFLIAAWCYARSSARLYDWLHHNRYFGKYIKNYRQGHGVSLSAKISTIIILWAGILYSIFSVEHLIVRLVLLAIAVGVTVHMIMIPTHRES